MLTVLAAIKNRNIDDEGLKQIKIDLTCELIKRDLDTAKYNKIWAFLAHYVNFENPKMMSRFKQEVEQLTGRTTPMGVIEILLERREKIGIEKGIEKTEARKNHDFVENLILELNLPDEQIARIVDVSDEFVKKVREEIASRK